MRCSAPSIEIKAGSDGEEEVTGGTWGWENDPAGCLFEGEKHVHLAANALISLRRAASDSDK
jgi:hypothetical protein